MSSATSFALSARFQSSASFGYADTRALVHPTNFSDGKHWNDSGHNLVGTCAYNCQAAALTAMGISSGTVKVGEIGDSRLAGTDATTIGTTDARAIRKGLAAGRGYTDSPVGPVADVAGHLHFARSGYTTRSNTISAQTGHSPRNAHAASLDAFVGSGKSYNDTRLWIDSIHVNDVLGITESAANEWDWADERLRSYEYLCAQQFAINGWYPGIVILNEPLTSDAATAWSNRMITAYNRELHAVARMAVAAGATVRMGDLHG